MAIGCKFGIHGGTWKRENQCLTLKRCPDCPSVEIRCTHNLRLIGTSDGHEIVQCTECDQLGVVVGPNGEVKLLKPGIRADLTD